LFTISPPQKKSGGKKKEEKERKEKGKREGEVSWSLKA